MYVRQFCHSNVRFLFHSACFSLLWAVGRLLYPYVDFMHGNLAASLHKSRLKPFWNVPTISFRYAFDQRQIDRANDTYYGIPIMWRNICNTSAVSLEEVKKTTHTPKVYYLTDTKNLIKCSQFSLILMYVSCGKKNFVKIRIQQAKICLSSLLWLFG